MSDDRPDEIISIIADGPELHFFGPLTIEFDVPIEWTPFNEWAFLRGVVMAEEITRQEFAKRYPAPIK